MAWNRALQNERTGAEVPTANPRRGQRGDFLKITVTMPAKMLGELKTLGLRRRARGQKDTDISSLVREAVTDLLKKRA